MLSQAKFNLTRLQAQSFTPRFGTANKKAKPDRPVRTDETMIFGPKLSLLYYPGTYTADDIKLLVNRAPGIQSFPKPLEVCKPSPLEWQGRIKSDDASQPNPWISQPMSDTNQNAQAFDQLVQRLGQTFQATA